MQITPTFSNRSQRARLSKKLENFEHTYLPLNEDLEYFNIFSKLFITKKYPLRGYILGVLTHTTTLDRLWGSGKTLQ